MNAQAQAAPSLHARGAPPPEAQPHEGETLAERYSRMAHEGWRPRRSTSRCAALDILIAGLALVAARAAAWRSLGARPARLAGARSIYRGVRVGKAGRVFTMFKFRTLANGRRDAPRPLPRRRAQPPDRGRDHARRPRAARRAPRRASAARERARRRHEPRRPAPDPARPSSSSSASRSRSTGSGSSCRPGMTGFAQLRMTREMTWEEKLAHDLEYIADRSLAPLPRRARRDRRLVQPAPRTRRRLDRCAASAGSRRRRGAAPDADALAAMSATLVHRGPDDEGQVVDGPVALAARRLSIIDLAGGHQPIASEDGRVTSSRTARSTTTPSCARELERARAPLPRRAATPR